MKKSNRQPVGPKAALAPAGAKFVLAIFWLLGSLIAWPVFAQLPPVNPYLVNSPFPAVHGGSFRQGNSSLPGLQPGDKVKIDFAETPFDRVSPWLLYSEAYPNGTHTIWGSTSTHLFKAVSTPSEFKVVSSYQIDKNPMINDLSWSMLLMDNHRILTYDDNILYLFGEENNSDPHSKTVLLKKIEMPKQIETVSKLCRLYDGKIAFASSNGILGILDDQTFALLATYQIPLERREIAFHNDYAVDDKGILFITTSKKMLAVQWNGQTIAPKWSLAMDFGGNRFQGVGTTPTLLGHGTDDKLVCVVDSQTPARMLTFWRDEIPADWPGLPNQNRRIAAITELPNSKPPKMMFAAVENSPTAYGYSIAGAQYNGLLGQPCDNLKGIYKMTWHPQTNEMKMDWVRNDLNMNNVLVYSIASDFLYGSGRESDCNYYYYTLDWKTGKTIRRDLMGNDVKFDDPGNANIIEYV
ncbi:MAG: hypothetical protein MUC97_18275 [Bernardetiaceae bacterium]|nr:hypothetical protein [Bernardetiaceae bacterium]